MLNVFDEYVETRDKGFELIADIIKVTIYFSPSFFSPSWIFFVSFNIIVFCQRNQGRAGDAQSHALIVQAQMRSQYEIEAMLKKNDLNSMVNNCKCQN